MAIDYRQDFTKRAQQFDPYQSQYKRESKKITIERYARTLAKLAHDTDENFCKVIYTPTPSPSPDISISEIKSVREAITAELEKKHPNIYTKEYLFNGEPYLKDTCLPVSQVLGQLYELGDIEAVVNKFSNKINNEQVKGIIAYIHDFLQSAYNPEIPTPLSTSIAESKGFSNILTSLAELNEEHYDEDFLAPTFFAITSVINHLRTASRPLGDSLPIPNIIADGDGGIRVEWRNAEKDLRLLHPASEVNQIKLYFQEGKKYWIDNLTTDDDLVNGLRWLIND